MSDDELGDVVPLRPELEEGDGPVRTRERPPYCPGHATATELDTEARRVYCRACGREVDPFDALLVMAEHLERYLRSAKSAEAQARRRRNELEAVERELRNAKTRARRARKAPADELAPRRPGAPRSS